MTDPTVPSWIAKALILTPNYTGRDDVMKTTSWRATRTQVVVTTERGERRFYLKDLTEVGSRAFDSMRARLVPPDDKRVIRALQRKKIRDPLSRVQAAVTAQRLQDSNVTAEEAVRKLTAVQDAVSKALASLAEVL